MSNPKDLKIGLGEQLPVRVDNIKLDLTQYKAGSHVSTPSWWDMTIANLVSMSPMVQCLNCITAVKTQFMT